MRVCQKNRHTLSGLITRPSPVSSLRNKCHYRFFFRVLKEIDTAVYILQLAH